MSGVVYLIGAGPGDPGLITVRGRELLGRCDVVLYDALAHPSLLEHTRADAVLRFVGKRGGRFETPQAEINAALVEHARAGKIVGRLKGGDPLLFARGAEEALFLAEHGVRFEIVPGISSPVAASAYAGIPLTHRDHASSVLFLTGTPRAGTGPDGHDYRRLATRSGTICVLMGLSRVGEIAAELIRHGRPVDTPAAVIQRGSWSSQRVVEARLDELAGACEGAGLGGPALIVIGDVVRLRAQLAWFEARPLFGRRVLVTRARAQAGALCERLRELGAEPVLAPTIETRPVLDEGLDDAVARRSAYDVAAFTSANGARAALDATWRLGLDARAWATVKLAAVGPATARALAERGLRADLVAEDHRGEALGAEILRAHPRARVALFRARAGLDVLPDVVRRGGGEVTVVTAYETLPARPELAEPLVDQLSRGELDAVTLMSPSAVDGLAATLGPRAGELLSRAALVSIGPTTSDAVRARGWRVAATAATHSLEGLVDALVATGAARGDQAGSSSRARGASGSGGASKPSV
ncbi:MAG: uroporphyrinogen-III C-methyltransferase [Polyangiaceae bacterium]|nr:uroporphyrinogen-III C-methyltransferase [Polyangiaceae bacterium]